LSIGNNIPTINNSVRVDAACAGAETMLQLWALAIVAIFLLPTTRRQKVIIPLTALVIAFLVNSIRVAILVTIVHDRSSFDYWHLGQGGQIFPLAAIIVWGIICKFIIINDQPRDHQKL
jgi:exosortase/archaeosortase family protein